MTTKRQPKYSMYTWSARLAGSHEWVTTFTQPVEWGDPCGGDAETVAQCHHKALASESQFLELRDWESLQSEVAIEVRFRGIVGDNYQTIGQWSVHCKAVQTTAYRAQSIVCTYKGNEDVE